MMQAPESRKGGNAVTDCRPDCNWTMCWRVFREPQMGLILMVVAHILGHQPRKRSLVHDEDVMQQVTPAASHPTLSNPVLPRTAKCRAHWLASHVSCRRDYVIAKFRVAVEYQEPVRRYIRPRFPHLLHDPESIRIACDVET